MYDKEYHNAEMRRFYRRMASVDHAPLSERREGREEWQKTLTMPEIVKRNLSFLLNGDYGYAEIQAAILIVKDKDRTNKVTRLGVLLAALDDNCPANFAVQAWKSLTTEQQEAVNAAIQEEIDDYLREEQEENSVQA